MLQRLNIGFILPSFPTYSETFFHSKITGLINNGHKVSLFINSDNTSTSITDLTAIYIQADIGKKYLMPFILLKICLLNPLRLAKFIKLESDSNVKYLTIIKHIIINSHILSKRLDWLHFGFATMGIQRENVAKAIGAKSTVSFRGFDIGLYPYQHPNCYNLLFKRIDKVHTISDDLYQRAIELGLDPNIPSEKIQPAINTEFFNSNLNENFHNPLRILTVGRLAWKKGYEYALGALSLLKDKQINFEYHIVGAGNYKEAIVYAIHQLKLTDNVKLKGQLSHEEVKQEMEWADIYVQPSIQEGFCNAVLEAQAMRLLCIVSDAEGLSENVIHEKTGWVIKKRDSTAIANTIIIILNDNVESLNKIRNNCVNHIESNFNLRSQNKRWNSFYY